MSLNWKSKAVLGLVAGLSLCASSVLAQDRYRDWDGQRFTRLEPGMSISVRVTDSIDIARNENRVFYGVVDSDVLGDNGRLAIPRGSRVELIARPARNGDLILDME